MATAANISLAVFESKDPTIRFDNEGRCSRWTRGTARFNYKSALLFAGCAAMVSLGARFTLLRQKPRAISHPLSRDNEFRLPFTSRSDEFFRRKREAANDPRENVDKRPLSRCDTSEWRMLPRESAIPFDGIEFEWTHYLP